MAYANPHILALQEKNPSAVELAEAVSCASAVEPQLLRRARRELLFEADAGTEADVWLSSIVQARSPSSIVFDQKIRQALANEFSQRDPDRFQQAWNFLRIYRSHAPLVVQLEEEINYLLALGGETSIAQIEQILSRVMATLLSNRNRRGLANWAARLLPKLPESIRKLNSASFLAGITYIELAGIIPEWPQQMESVPGWLAWILPPDFPERKIRVRFVSRGVELSSAPQDNPNLSVPATDPLLIEVSWNGESGREVERVQLADNAQTVVETRVPEVELRTITGQRVTLRQRREEKQIVEPIKKTCFVVMGFGKKTDYQTGRVLDLDKSYNFIIKPAAEAAGLNCVRADEIVHAGVIDVPMYEQLLRADVVVADLSTSNPDAFYQLGMRHALRPYTTITIAEDKMVLPFNTSYLPVRKYRHLGDGLDFGEVERMRSELTQAMRNVIDYPTTDSPIYMFLSNLRPPELLEPNSQADMPPTPPPSSNPTLSTLVQQADSAFAKSDYVTAIALLKSALSSTPANTDVRRKLALATYRSGLPTRLDALNEARELLQELDPLTTNDTETLSLWASVHKRIFDSTSNPATLDTAIRAYEKAFLLKDDYYNGINLAFLLDVRAVRQSESLAEGVADAVLAQRTRRHVIELCQQALQLTASNEDRYWIIATIAEAYVGLGNQAQADAYLAQAAASSGSQPWMRDATLQQLENLRKVLQNSPLQHLPTLVGAAE